MSPPNLLFFLKIIWLLWVNNFLKHQVKNEAAIL